MAKKVLSVEVGMQQTRICEMDYVKNNPKVYSCITFDTPEGTVEDGFINDTGKFAQAMRDALDRARITTKDIVFSIASTKIANREVTIPLVKDNKIMQVITASASEYFPVDISDYALSYTIQQRINTKTEKQLVLMLLAAPNNLVRGYYSVARDMRLHVEAIDYTGNSLFQIIRKQVRKGVNMSLQINEQTTLINIIEDDKLILQRIIPYGTTAIIDTVKEHTVFGADSDKTAMELLRREKMLNMHFNEGGTSTTATTGLENMSDSYGKAVLEQKGREEITESLSYLVNNFTRVLDYYNSRNSDKLIKEVILAGPGSNIRGIEELLRNEIGIDMHKLNSMFGVTFTRKANVRDFEQADYITCVGAVLAPVGFTVKDVTSTVVRDGSSTPYAVGLAIAVLAAAGGCAGTYFWAQSEETRQETLNSDIAKYSTVNDTFLERDNKVLQLTAVEEFYNMTVTSNDYYNDLVGELESHLPANAVINSISLSDDAISFSVTCNDEFLSVPKLIMSLNEIEMLRDVYVSSTSTEGKNKNSTQTFSVSCAYRQTEIARKRAEEETVTGGAEDAAATDDTAATDGTAATDDVAAETGVQ